MALSKMPPNVHFESIGGFDSAKEKFEIDVAGSLWNYQKLYLRDLENENGWFWWYIYYTLLKKVS